MRKAVDGRDELTRSSSILLAIKGYLMMMMMTVEEEKGKADNSKRLRERDDPAIALVMAFDSFL